MISNFYFLGFSGYSLESTENGKGVCNLIITTSTANNCVVPRTVLNFLCIFTHLILFFHLDVLHIPYTYNISSIRQMKKLGCRLAKELTQGDIVSGLLEFFHRQFSFVDCSVFLFFFLFFCSFSRQRNILKTPSKVYVRAYTLVCIELSRLKGCNHKAASFPTTNALSNLPYGARPFLNTLCTPGRLHSFPIPSEIRKGTPDT